MDVNDINGDGLPDLIPVGEARRGQSRSSSTMVRATFAAIGVRSRSGLAAGMSPPRMSIATG